MGILLGVSSGVGIPSGGSSRYSIWGLLQEFYLEIAPSIKGLFQEFHLGIPPGIPPVI